MNVRVPGTLAWPWVVVVAADMGWNPVKPQLNCEVGGGEVPAKCGGEMGMSPREMENFHQSIVDCYLIII